MTPETPNPSPPSGFIPSNKPILGAEEMEAVRRVLESGILTHKSGAGPYVRQFEEAFARFVGARHAVAVNTGTAALHAALMAVGVGRGDEVIVPSFTFIATSNMVILCGAKPVLVDIEPHTYNLDPEKVKEAITPRTKAIMPVHLYGHPAHMDPLLELAEERGLAVIEDCAQAHGSLYRGRQVGTLGDVGCFSFYPSKVITTGEGGILTTNSDELAERLRRIRSHGEARPYDFVEMGHNYHMPEMAAAIGVEQVKRLPKLLEERRRNAQYLTKHLEDVEWLVLPRAESWATHNWYLYTVRIAPPKSRDEVHKALNRAKIGAAIYYSVPIHLTPFYRKLYGYKEGSLPVSEEASRQVLSLPTHSALTKGDLDYIVGQLTSL